MEPLLYVLYYSLGFISGLLAHEIIDAIADSINVCRKTAKKSLS